LFPKLQEIKQIISNFPTNIDISLSLRWGTSVTALSSATPNVNWKDAKWIDVPADYDCLLDVTFSRTNANEASATASGGARPKKSALPAPPASSNNSGGRMNHAVYAPKFPKPKDEGWLLTLGSVDQQELLAMKRVTLPRAKCSQQLGFRTPSRFGRLVLAFYFLSDSYVGLDQQYTLHLNVCPATAEPLLEDEL
jgi:activating signal cointegrator complex subunit 3